VLLEASAQVGRDADIKAVGVFQASENIYVGHADFCGSRAKARLRPLGYGAAAFARFAQKI
jgi:hypothetical protein